jgi:hypothetical protein
MQRDPRTTNAFAAALVVAVRVLLVVLAAAAVVTAVVVSRREHAVVVRRYSCPMHSEVTASSPGDCPICGMALEETGPGTGPTGGPIAGSMGGMPRGAKDGDDAVAEDDTIGIATLRGSTESTKLLRFSVARARHNAFRGEVHTPAISEADGTVTAQLYRDELASLAPDDLVELIPASAPGTRIKLQRDAIPPLIQGAIARVRFHAEPGSFASSPAGTGWVKLPNKVRPVLVVRSQGIVNAPDGPYVLVFSADRGAITKRHVEIGKDYGGMTAVMSGLSDKDYVVMANTYSFDAERRLKAAQ